MSQYTKHHPLNTHIELFYQQEKKNLLCSAIVILTLLVQQQLAYSDYYRCQNLSLTPLLKFFPPPT